jgi:hypothetical protein
VGGRRRPGRESTRLFQLLAGRNEISASRWRSGEGVDRERASRDPPVTQPPGVPLTSSSCGILSAMLQRWWAALGGNEGEAAQGDAMEKEGLIFGKGRDSGADGTGK